MDRWGGKRRKGKEELTTEPIPEIHQRLFSQFCCYDGIPLHLEFEKTNQRIEIERMKSARTILSSLSSSLASFL